MRQAIITVWEGLLDLLYPPFCLLCGTRLEAGAMCVVCQKDVTPLSPPFCARCGVPVTMEETVCAECLRGEPPFAWSVAAGFYGGTLRRAIHLLKYHEKAALAEPLGMILAQNLGEPSSPLFEEGRKEPQFDAVIPVPLHRSRLRARGFNQAERLARVVARERGWHLDTTLLQRTKATRSQTTLSGEARRENMRGAFAVAVPQAVVGKSILLVDDVLTTTSTVAECARVLQEEGARRVCVATVARGG